MDYQLVIFDMDGTLTESRSPVDKEMSDLLCKLIAQKTVAIISGGPFKQVQEQVLNFLPRNQYSGNLHIASLSGGSLHCFQNGKWEKLYELELNPTEKQKIMAQKKIQKERFSLIDSLKGERIINNSNAKVRITFARKGGLNVSVS